MENVIEIPLTKGAVALIDAADYELVRGYKWRLHTSGSGILYAITGNARRGGGRPRVLMHRLLLAVTDPRVKVDHRDGNGLNNCRYNMRRASNAENCRNRVRLSIRNSSGVTGVFHKKGTGKWEARITVDRTAIGLGTFGTLLEAADARRGAELKYYGDFAPLR